MSREALGASDANGCSFRTTRHATTSRNGRFSDAARRLPQRSERRLWALRNVLETQSIPGDGGATPALVQPTKMSFAFGVAGFAPAASGTQSRHAIQAALHSSSNFPSLARRSRNWHRYRTWSLFLSRFLSQVRRTTSCSRCAVWGYDGPFRTASASC